MFQCLFVVITQTKPRNVTVRTNTISMHRNRSVKWTPLSAPLCACPSCIVCWRFFCSFVWYCLVLMHHKVIAFRLLRSPTKRNANVNYMKLFCFSINNAVYSDFQILCLNWNWPKPCVSETAIVSLKRIVSVFDRISYRKTITVGSVRLSVRSNCRISTSDQIRIPLNNLWNFFRLCICWRRHDLGTWNVYRFN